MSGLPFPIRSPVVRPKTVYLQFGSRLGCKMRFGPFLDRLPPTGSDPSFPPPSRESATALPFAPLTSAHRNPDVFSLPTPSGTGDTNKRLSKQKIARRAQRRYALASGNTGDFHDADQPARLVFLISFLFPSPNVVF